MKQRQPGIDLLRCTGLLFVVGVHAFLKNGFYFVPQEGWLMWLADSARWLFFCCNGLFMMLTGYLKSTGKWEKRYYRGLVAVLLGYFFTCVVSFPIRHFLLDERNSAAQWLVKMLNFDNYGWYVEMYIGLILFSPFINLAIQNVKDRQLLWLAGTMVALTSLHSATELVLAPDYWSALYPVTYYVIGAAIRRLQPKVSFWAGAILTAAAALGMGAASVISTDSGFYEGFDQGYGGFWTMLLTTLIFLTLYRATPGERSSKALSWAAGGVFEGYIMSRLLDVWIYAQFPQWHHPQYYPLLFVCVTLPVFLAALLMGKAVHAPVEWVMGLFPTQEAKKRVKAK